MLWLLSLALAISLGWCAVPPDPNLSANLAEFIHGVVKLDEKVSIKFCDNVDSEVNLIKIISKTHPVSKYKNGSDYFNHLFVLDVGTCESSELSAVLSNNNIRITYSRWILVDSSQSFGATSVEKVEQIVGSVNLTQASELFFLTIENGQLKLRMVYKMERVHPGKVLFEEVGFYARNNVSQFVFTREHNVTSMRRRKMKGIQFPISVVLRDPDSINHFFDLVDVEIDTVGKTGQRQGVAILQFMDATPALVVSNSWGSYNSTTKQWSGMFQDLNTGRAEFGGTPSFMVSERVDVVDYMSLGVETWTRIVFKAPKLSYTTNVYLLPFEKNIWVAASVLFIAMTLLLLLAATGEWKNTTAGSEGEKPHITEIAFVIFSAICNQGSSFNLNSISGRIIFISCLVLVVCLFVSYCAFIVVLLQAPATNIRTAQDVLNSRMQIGAEDTIYNRYWLKRLTDPVEKAIVDRRLLNKDGSLNLYSLEEGVKKVQQGLFAFHMEVTVGYRYVSKFYEEGEKCDLREVTFANMANPYTTHRKDSPYREALRIGMLRVKEQGIQRRLSKQVYTAKPKCNAGGGFSVLTLVDISPAIFILSFGCVASLLVLACEVIYYRYSQQKE